MEYTKDVIYNVKYSKNFRILHLSKRGFFKNIKNFIKENKFISVIFISMATFIVIDIILINIFMNLIVTL